MTETQTLKSKAIKGSLWATVEKFSLLISQFIIGIILARLLEPSDFGLIALTTIFITISNAISDCGFETALIQNKELSSIQINTAFYFNIILGCFMMVVVCLLAPFISTFFNEPKLIIILRILSIMLPLEALAQTQRTLLMRELNFKKISIYQIVSSIISGIVGIILAYCHFGVWALVYSTILSLVIRVLFLWIQSSWYPALVFSYSSIANLIPFGLNVLLTSVLYFFIQQFNSLIIGKYYTEKDLGLFNRGMKFPEIVISIIQSVILKMALPLFAKLQDQNEKLQSLKRKTNSIIAFLTFPLLLFLFLDAKEIIITLLTSKWIGAIIYLKIFCIIRLFDPFISIQKDLLLAKGKAKLSLRLSILTSLLETIPILIYAKNGILYILWIVLISKILQYVIYLVIDSKYIKTNILYDVKLLIYYFLISIIVAIGVEFTDYSIPYLNHDHILPKIIIDLFIGGGFYMLLCYLFRKEDLSILKNILQTINKSKRGNPNTINPI